MTNWQSQTQDTLLLHPDHLAFELSDKADALAGRTMPEPNPLIIIAR